MWGQWFDYTWLKFRPKNNVESGVVNLCSSLVRLKRQGKSHFLLMILGYLSGIPGNSKVINASIPTRKVLLCKNNCTYTFV